jgi:hypothetical protein
MKEVWTRGHTIGDLQILQIHRFFQGHFSSHIGNLSGCLLSHQMQQVSLIWKHRPCNRKPGPMTYDIRIGNLLGSRGQILLGPRMLQSTDTQPGLFKLLHFFQTNVCTTCSQNVIVKLAAMPACGQNNSLLLGSNHVIRIVSCPGMSS